MFDLFVEDSLVFLSAALICLAVLWRRTRHCKALRPFGLLYIAGTLSSYNIMVKPVHDYNLVIPRTFLTHGKFVGPLSVLDALMILGLLLAWLWPGRTRQRNSVVPKEFRLILLKDLALAGLSLLLFLYLMDRTASPLGGELAWYRQIIYLVALFAVVDRFLQRHPPVDLLQVFVTFMWIDAINLLSGYVSTLVYGDLTWQRYFLNVTIIDQDDVMIAVMYPLILMCMWVNKSRFQMSRTVIGFSLLISALLFANFYKGSIAYILLFLPFLVVYAWSKKRNTSRPMTATLAILPVAALFYWIFFVLSSTASLETRANQFSDLTAFMGSTGTAYPVVGIGNGTLYDRNSSDEDEGETKQIDQEENPNKASAMQSPGAQIYKAVGLPGLLLHAAALLLACSRMIRKVIVNHPIAVASGYLICMHFALNFLFLDPTGVVAFLIVKLYLFTTLAKRHQASLDASVPG